MTRLTLLAGLGLGYAVAPHVVWLIGIGLVVLAAVGPDWWRKQTRPLSVQIERTQQHFHYCTDCDRQWSHAGEGPACIRHWASACGDCAQPPDAAERRTA